MTDQKATESKPSLEIDLKEFRVINTVNGSMMCSKVEDLGFDVLKVYHPYWMFTEVEEDIWTFVQADTWNPKDHIRMSKDKVVFMTEVDHHFTVEFRDCLKLRLAEEANESIKESTKGNSKVVSLLDRSKFN